jgi:mono/diheme cytochrome c family protein
LTPNTGKPQGLEAVGVAKFSPEESESLKQGQKIYEEVCIVCHGSDARGEPVLDGPIGATRTPPLASSPRVTKHHDYIIKALLHGLQGPIDGKTYTDVMVPMGAGPDDWIAAIASYVRNAFGNRGSMVTATDVARVRAATEQRVEPWTIAELESTLPQWAPVEASWKVSASHNTATAPNALSIRPWTSGRTQEPGMWLQVELPRPILLTEVQFDSSPAAIEAEPAVLGAPTRTGVPRGQPAPTTFPSHPRGFQVQVSQDGTTWSAPVSQGVGMGRRTNAPFAPTQAKFVRVTLTAKPTETAPWSVEQLRLFVPGPGIRQ